jgi:uncharacterized protein YcnI
MRSKVTIAAAMAAAALGAAAPSASAHVTVAPAEAPADSYAKLTFGVPHGCGGSPTTRLRIHIPPTIPSVTPQVSPGWSIATREGRKRPVELHGERVDRGVSEVVFTARRPLPDDRYDELGMSVKLPAGEVGEAVRFPAIQTCSKGETAWIQVPRPEESVEELDEPAPTLELAATDEERGGGASPAPMDDDGPSTALVVVALALGALGLATAIAALLATRRRAA